MTPEIEKGEIEMKKILNFMFNKLKEIWQMILHDGNYIFLLALIVQTVSFIIALSFNWVIGYLILSIGTVFLWVGNLEAK